jgi:hypothetical protein
MDGDQAQPFASGAREAMSAARARDQDVSDGGLDVRAVDAQVGVPGPGGNTYAFDVRFLCTRGRNREAV